MPSFQKLFEEVEGTTIQYEGKTLYCADKFPVKDGDVLIASIEKTNSEWIQGFSIDITGSYEVMIGSPSNTGQGIITEE